MANLVTESLLTVWKWGQKHGPIFNPTKTVVCMFETSRKCKHEPPVNMGGKELAYQDIVKYLGLTQDKRLTWSKHVKEVSINAHIYLKNEPHCRMWMGLHTCKNKVGLSAIIKPKLMYGSVVWAYAIFPTSKNRLERLQRSAVNHLVKLSFKSTPTKGMVVLLGLPPLPLSIEESALNVATRLRRPNLSKWRRKAI